MVSQPTGCDTRAQMAGVTAYIVTPHSTLCIREKIRDELCGKDRLAGAMANDSRLSRVLHILLHMARIDYPLTSEFLAKSFNTNPVVIRRLMAGLRKRGYVRSSSGRGGGWMIACDPNAVTLLDIHEALGEPRIIALGHDEPYPACVVGQIVNASLGEAFQRARSIMLEQLASVTLGQLAREFDAKCREANYDLRQQPHFEP